MMGLLQLLRRIVGSPTVDPAWKPTGIKPMERTWRVDADHDDPRAKRQLIAEMKARKAQAQRRDGDSNIKPFRRQA